MTNNGIPWVILRAVVGNRHYSYKWNAKNKPSLENIVWVTACLTKDIIRDGLDIADAKWEFVNFDGIFSVR